MGGFIVGICVAITIWSYVSMHNLKSTVDADTSEIQQDNATLQQVINFLNEQISAAQKLTTK